jgi:hypothetical protein
MSASNAFETALMGLIFEGTTITGIADNTATSPATNLYISLHSSDPGEAGNQSTGEATYTGYARVAVARTSSGWTITGGSVTNDAAITFGQCTAGAQTLTHVGLGLASSGGTTLLLSNALDSSLALAIGSTPLFSAGNLTFTVD